MGITLYLGLKLIFNPDPLESKETIYHKMVIWRTLPLKLILIVVFV